MACLLIKESKTHDAYVVCGKVMFSVIQCQSVCSPMITLVSHIVTLPTRWTLRTPQNGLYPLPDSDSDLDSDTESCTMQDFSIGLDLDSDPLIEMYVIGTEICPWDGDPSLKWVQSSSGNKP